ncbi:MULTISPECIES: hypothetical protein [Rhizobium]|uniref:Uncharacterized protein n=1 Tax=Rhizobium wuzhouense TaxID=1986026 RepID=A0ABX5NP89_9HYPH|nr:MULTISPECIES: hypothetical protein [Rhizobium]PYB71402.1 hypothetical protein DMY87_18845 [Rhizobium wuzhouense]RKE85004.1 hypothetical protein DFO46_1787 [Rhizobium sp. AG855]
MINLQTAGIPMILTPQDFSIMEDAMRGIGALSSGRDRDIHRESVGKAVIKLYLAGITDPTKLAEAADTLSAMRLLNRRG